MLKLTLATHETRYIVQNMFVSYFYDLSQYDDQIIINAHGLPMWEPFGLPGPRTADECAPFNWWIRDKCQLYIIEVAGQPAGFVIILADKTELIPEVDIELMDFYIVPKYRRQGLGRQAARAAFGLYHGRWQVFQLERNAAARAFWQAIIKDYTHDQYENLDGGTQQRFNN